MRRCAGANPGSAVRGVHAARLCIAVAACLLLAGAGSPLAAQGNALPRADTVVTPQAYVSLEPAPRGRTLELAVVARIRPGFHINSHAPLEDYLIPTSLEGGFPEGFRAEPVAYPPGLRRKFKFSESELSVYEGSVTFRMKIHVLPGASLGPRRLALKLRYQACNEESCLPPVRIPVNAEVRVAPAGTKARSVHPSIFRASEELR